MSALLEVRNLHFTYDDGARALNGIDFDLEKGQVTAIFGANGSGKTTFAHHLNGLLRGSGSIVIDGLPLDDGNLAAIRKRVGLVFQNSDNQLFMPSVLEDVAFGLLASGVPAGEAADRARAALDKVGMLPKAQKAPWQLSAGEKKRAAIAGILVSEPALMIFDEPTTFLDPPGQRDLAELLLRLPQAKLIVTHDTAFARRLTQDAAFFEKGRIAERGPIREIIERFGW